MLVQSDEAGAGKFHGRDRRKLLSLGHFLGAGCSGPGFLGAEERDNAPKAGFSHRSSAVQVRGDQM